MTSVTPGPRNSSRSCAARGATGRSTSPARTTRWKARPCSGRRIRSPASTSAAHPRPRAPSPLARYHRVHPVRVLPPGRGLLVRRGRAARDPAPRSRRRRRVPGVSARQRLKEDRSHCRSSHEQRRSTAALHAFLMSSGHHEAPGGCRRATRSPTPTSRTGVTSPRSPSGPPSTRCSWPTGRLGTDIGQWVRIAISWRALQPYPDIDRESALFLGYSPNLEHSC